MTSKFFRFLSRRGPKPDNKSDCNRKANSQTHSTALNIFGVAADTKNKPIKLNDGDYNQQYHTMKEIPYNEKMLNKINDLSKKSTRNSKFFSFRSKSKYLINDKNGPYVQKDSFQCSVVFLDGTQENFYVSKKEMASKLYEKVFYHLDLIETDYFGLQYTDSHNIKQWLDPTKLIKKQCKTDPPYQFYFKVKFFVAEPNNLKEEITRYLYFLQLRNDLRTGKLPCSQENLAVDLCTLILQEELGDYDPANHTIETVADFCFLPECQQSKDFEELVYTKYSTSTAYKSMSPGESELIFLNKAKWLEMYGVNMHCVYGKDGNDYKLGLTPSGIIVFEEVPAAVKNTAQAKFNNKIGLFYWPRIVKVMFSRKKFTILVSEDACQGAKQEHTFHFNLIDEKACKHLWKCAVEYHSFFRLKTSLLGCDSSQLSSTSGFFNGFIRKGSRFRGPERTEYQTMNMSRKIVARRSVQFERKPSQRFSKRASYAIKRKLQENQKRGLSINTTDILNTEKTISNEAPASKPTVANSAVNNLENTIPAKANNKFTGSVDNKSFKNKSDSRNTPSQSNTSSLNPKCNISKAHTMEKMARQVNCKAEPAKPANKNLQQNCEPSKKTCYQQMIQNNSATDFKNNKSVADKISKRPLNEIIQNHQVKSAHNIRQATQNAISNKSNLNVVSSEI